MKYDTRLVAFCGIDGSGKSTLLSKLKDEEKYKSSIYEKKLIQDNLKLVLDYHDRYYNDGRDWIFSKFGQSAAIATCLDFMRHYDENIKPHIGKVPFIFCDRYSLCYDAYLHSTELSMDMSVMFNNIKVPDIIFHVDVPVELAVNRHDERGGAKEDEHPDVMIKFHKAYTELIPKLTSKVVRLDNTQSIDIVHAQVMNNISELEDV